jgi:hypothetical protein
MAGRIPSAPCNVRRDAPLKHCVTALSGARVRKKQSPRSFSTARALSDSPNLLSSGAGVDGAKMQEIVPEKNEARNRGGLKRGGVLSKERAR